MKLKIVKLFIRKSKNLKFSCIFYHCSTHTHSHTHTHTHTHTHKHTHKRINWFSDKEKQLFWDLHTHFLLYYIKPSLRKVLKHQDHNKHLPTPPTLIHTLFIMNAIITQLILLFLIGKEQAPPEYPIDNLFKIIKFQKGSFSLSENQFIYLMLYN